MVKDEVLMDRLRSENQDFKKWADLHSHLENKLQNFNRLKFLTSEEEVEKKRLQKQKLNAKDHMQLILYQYRRLN